MKFPPEMLRFVIALILLVCGTSFSWAQFGAPGRTKGFKWPEYYPQQVGNPPTNAVKTMMLGEEAIPQLNGLILLKGMRIENYLPNGKLNLVARAPQCTLSPADRIIYSDGSVAIESGAGQLQIQGVGFLCELTNFVLTISNSVETQIRRELVKSFGSRGATNSGINVIAAAATNQVFSTNALTYIRANRFAFDLPNNLVVYSGDVKVTDALMELTCERLNIKRATNGTLERIVAERNVAAWNKQDNSRITGDMGIYKMAPDQETLDLSGDLAHWSDGVREGKARSFLLDRRNNILYADGSAWMQLPRSAVSQPQFLSAKTTPTTNTPVTRASSNDVVQISAEHLVFELPGSNRVAHRIEAITNVIILSPSDKSRATAERAEYREAQGTVELSGNAVWEAGQRIVRGERLRFDRTNKVFTSIGHAYVKLPVSEIGRQGAFSMKLRGTKTNPAPQFIEVYSDEFDYTSDLLHFRDHVRAFFLEENSVLGNLTCGSLGVKFSNQVEQITALFKVRAEQLPFRSRRGRITERQVECEWFRMIFATNGQIARMIAETNVFGVQSETRPRQLKPVQSQLKAQLVHAEFYPHTNQLQTLVAEGQVYLAQDEKNAKGERAIYLGEKDTLHLMGSPTAQWPGAGDLSQAEVLVWDRKQNKVRVLGRAAGQVPVAAQGTNGPFRVIP